MGNDKQCSHIDCDNKEHDESLCYEHFNMYKKNYIDNGYTWCQINKIIVNHNQKILFFKNRLELIKNRYYLMNTESENDNNFDFINDEINNDEINNDDDFIYDDYRLPILGDDYESMHLLEGKLRNMQ